MQENKLKIMKKYLKLLPLLGLCSCLNQSANMSNAGKPFIVSKIESINDSLVYYHTNDFNGIETIEFHFAPSIIAKKGLYNIGDTIKLNK